MGLFASICNFFKGGSSASESSTNDASSSDGLTGVERYIRSQADATPLTGVERYIRSQANAAPLTGVERYIRSHG